MLLRGASKDVLNEIERNLQDALQVRLRMCVWMVRVCVCVDVDV